MKINTANEYPYYFARFYDLIYHKLRDGVDNQYFLDQIKQTNGKILEVGVGTGGFGRHSAFTNIRNRYK